MENPKKERIEVLNRREGSWQSELELNMEFWHRWCKNVKSLRLLQVRFDSILWDKSCPLLLVAIQKLIHITGRGADIRIETMKRLSIYFIRHPEGYYTHCSTKQHHHHHVTMPLELRVASVDSDHGMKFRDGINSIIFYVSFRLIAFWSGNFIKV